MPSAFTPFEIDLAIAAPDFHWLKITKWDEHWYADVPDVLRARDEAEARIDRLRKPYGLSRDAFETRIEKLKARLEAQVAPR